MPKKVAKRLFNAESRSIVAAIRKANKQIRATKRLLNMFGARGVVLVANDRNFGFDPKSMMQVIRNGFEKLSDCHIDCIVYFTPNIYHDVGDDIARTLWIPIYNVGSEGLAPFINDLGHRWHDYAEKFGEPYLSREVGDDLYDQIIACKPIREFKNMH